MGALRSSEMPVNFYRTVRYDIVAKYPSEMQCVFFEVEIEHVLFIYANVGFEVLTAVVMRQNTVQ
jgi:hypothetical protein